MCSGVVQDSRVPCRHSHAKAWARQSIVLKHTMCLCLVTMIAAMAAGRLAGQSVERLQVRADSLLREWRRASALADMVDSLKHGRARSEEHTSELQSHHDLVCRLL